MKSFLATVTAVAFLFVVVASPRVEAMALPIPAGRIIGSTAFTDKAGHGFKDVVVDLVLTKGWVAKGTGCCAVQAINSPARSWQGKTADGVGAGLLFFVGAIKMKHRPTMGLYRGARVWASVRSGALSAVDKLPDVLGNQAVQWGSMGAFNVVLEAGRRVLTSEKEESLGWKGWTAMFSQGALMGSALGVAGHVLEKAQVIKGVSPRLAEHFVKKGVFTEESLKAGLAARGLTKGGKALLIGTGVLGAVEQNAYFLFMSSGAGRKVLDPVGLALAGAAFGDWLTPMQVREAGGMTAGALAFVSPFKVQAIGTGSVRERGYLEGSADRHS
jgi:hypothetical protein